MATYEPIYLTTDEREQIALGKSLEILSDYLPMDEAAKVYVRRLGDVIEIRPLEGSLESFTILSRGMSGARPERMSVSCGGTMLEITIDNDHFHIYFSADEDFFSA